MTTGSKDRTACFKGGVAVNESDNLLLTCLASAKAYGSRPRSAAEANAGAELSLVLVGFHDTALGALSGEVESGRVLAVSEWCDSVENAPRPRILI